MSRKKIAVIGGGIAGLSAAWYLMHNDRQPVSVDLFEAQDSLGGKLKTEDLAGQPVDVGAEAYLAAHEELKELFVQLGLGQNLVSPGGFKSALWTGEDLVHIPAQLFMGIPASGDEVVDIVGSEAAARIDAELELEPLQWDRGTDMTVAELVEPRYGRTVIDKLVTPMQGGVYAASADSLGVQATLPGLAHALDEASENQEPLYLRRIIGRLLEERKTAQRHRGADPTKPISVFQTLDGGFTTAIDRLGEQSGATIIMNAPVPSVRADTDGWDLTVSIDGQKPVQRHYDGLVMALPAPYAAKLFENGDLGSHLADLDLSSVAVVAMHSPDPDILPEYSGVLFESEAPVKSKAMTYSSRKWPHYADHGGSTVRVSFGSLANTSVLELSDQELIDAAKDDFRTITGRTIDVDGALVQRWTDGLPNYASGHGQWSNRADELTAQFPPLGLTGSSYAGVGIPAIVARSKKVSEYLIGRLTKDAVS